MIKHAIILAPHISEKSSTVTDRQGQYVFKVCKKANKHEIKDAIEAVFNVKVSEVRVCNVRGKIKRFGQMMGKRKGWKKAYVSLQPGQKIDLGLPQA
jgi:large subunit ribosomal protein L23